MNKKNYTISISYPISVNGIIVSLNSDLEIITKLNFHRFFILQKPPEVDVATTVRQQQVGSHMAYALLVNLVE